MLLVGQIRVSVVNRSTSSSHPGRPPACRTEDAEVGRGDVESALRGRTGRPVATLRQADLRRADHLVGSREDEGTGPRDRAPTITATIEPQTSGIGEGHGR